jgi:hypothetical protein
MCYEGQTPDYEPLLYQLSYVGMSGGNIASTGAGYKRSTCSRFATRAIERPLAV